MSWLTDVGSTIKKGLTSEVGKAVTTNIAQAATGWLVGTIKAATPVGATTKTAAPTTAPSPTMGATPAAAGVGAVTGGVSPSTLQIILFIMAAISLGIAVALWMRR